MKKRITILIIAFLITGVYLGGKHGNYIFANLYYKFFPKTYTEILSSDIHPALPPSYNFPHSYQFLNGCYAFAVNSILRYKYSEGVDLIEMEEKIEKPRELLWSKKYVKAFLNEYDINMTAYSDSETFFKYLVEGEPVTVSYRYPLDENKWVLHIVAAYSFDKDGVWASDSLTGPKTHIPYQDLFDNSKRFLRYPFSTVLRDEP